MFQRPLNTNHLALNHRIEQAITSYAEKKRVSVDKVPPYLVAKELQTDPTLAKEGLSNEGWIRRVQEVRSDMVERAALSHERGREFSQATLPSTRHGAKPLPSNSPLFMLGKGAAQPKAQPRPKAPKSSAPKAVYPTFRQGLAAMESRATGKTIDVDATSPEALGIAREHLTAAETLNGGLVLSDFPDLDPVGQGRVEVHPFRWSALRIDPMKTGEDGTTLVIRSRHWADKIAGEGAAFSLSLVGGNTLPVKINSVKPDQHAGVVVLNLSDADLSKMIGGAVGRNLTFKVDAAFTDDERPKGRHTQRCEFNIPTDHVADVERVRVGWGEHETVDINLPRTDGVVRELMQSIPELQSMTTMMETEAEFVLPSNFDMLEARQALYALATDPGQATKILGEGWAAYPADKYIRKDLGALTPEAYEKLPMAERAKLWKLGQDGLPETIGHTDTILDTPDRALLNKGLILRVRANERGTVVSLKSVSAEATGPESRVRFCADAALDKGTSLDDAIRVAGELLKHAGTDPLDQNPFVDGLRSAGIELGEAGLELQPTLQVTSQRDRVRLVDTKDSSNIELSLDRSTITPFDAKGRLVPEKAVTSLGYEFGLEHAGVNPTDNHGPSTGGDAPKAAVAGFRGFHVPSDLQHPSLHDPDSTRNRALLSVVSGLKAPIFGESTDVRPGGFKAVEGAEAVGLIDASWRKQV